MLTDTNKSKVNTGNCICLSNECSESFDGFPVEYASHYWQIYFRYWTDFTKTHLQKLIYLILRMYIIYILMIDVSNMDMILAEGSHNGQRLKG